MKIVVTGGAGFIGSHLCAFLLQRREEVICVDNLYTGKKENIEPLLENRKFRFVQHDIIDHFVIDERVDQIYNLACPASPVHYQADPLGTIRANTLGVMNLLELAKQNNARILQASTSEIYGDPLQHPQSELYRGNVNPIGPRACYDEGKRIAETLFFDYRRQHTVDIRVARIFNTYGPHMCANDGRVVSNFIVQALNNKPITVYGDGNQTRSFCYISDLVLGLYLLMNSSCVGPCNLGNPTEYTITELAKKIIFATQSSSEVVFKELPIDDPHKRKPDITLAQKELQWEPQIHLEQGLEETIAWFKK
jgi:UDP-glucuronate decarboxylase